MNAKLNDGSSPQLETSALQRLVGFTERALFRNRVVVLLFFLVLSLLLGYQALGLRPDASFSRMIPTGHPFIQNYLQFESVLRPQSNVLRVVVENPGVMLWWGALITLLVGLSLWPWGAGLLVTGPLLGHASWHAYRAALEPQEPVPSE